MTEVQPAPVMPNGREKSVLRFTDLQQRASGKELRPFPHLEKWYREGVATFPIMEVQKGTVSMTEGKGWSADYQKDAEGNTTGVTRVGNDAFFSFEGVEVARGGTFVHAQPGLFEATKPIVMQTEYGDALLETSAYIGVVMDTQGNVLVGLGQEPLSDSPNHVIAKTPLQTSAGKFDLVFGDAEKGIVGDPSRDQAFYDTLHLIFPGDNTPEQFFDYVSQKDRLWPMGTINGNRLNSPNIAFVITVDDAKKDALTLDRKNIWINQAEIKALERAGLMNTIASAAFSAAIPTSIPQTASEE